MDITVENVVREVRMLATEQPDFIYTSQPERAELSPSTGQCSYLGAVQYQPGGHACIVGLILTRLGVPNETLQHLEGDGASGVVCTLTGVGLSRDATSTPLMTWLDDVQAKQDWGMSWAEAVAHADV